MELGAIQRQVRKDNSQPEDGVLASCVLHVLDHSWPIQSGYAVRSRNLISAQQKIGESLLVLTGPLHQLDDPIARNQDLDGVAYVRTPILGRFSEAALRKRWHLVREREVVRMLRKRILDIARERRVSVIYAHSPALCGLAGLQAARRLNLPFVYEIRAFWEDAATQNVRRPASIRALLTYKLETYVVRNADAVAAIAKPMLADLRSRGISSRKLFHTPNGVDASRFVPAARDETLAGSLGLADRPVFGFFGSLYRYEGVSWLIRAAAELRARKLKFAILIIGKGEDREEIDRAVRYHHAAEYVRIVDHVPHEQIARYYSCIDIAVYPRRSIRLTELVTPLKPLEAMALEKPVLASSVGGIQELVKDEGTGLLFQPENLADFCRQAERLIASERLRSELGKRGREFVIQERDWKVLATRYREIYDFVLSEQQSGHPRGPEDRLGDMPRASATAD